MGGRIKLVVLILGAAFLLGLLADALLRVGPWGINGTIWTIAFVSVLVGFTRWGGVPLSADRKAFLLVAIVFAVCFAWRDSTVLKALNVLALCSVFMVAVLPAAVQSIQQVALTHWVMACVDILLNGLRGLPALVQKDVSLKDALLFSDNQERRQEQMKHAKALASGILLSIPLVLIFGGLFTSADAAFNAIVDDAFDVDWSTFLGHVFVIGCCTWLFAGYLRLFCLKTGRLWRAEGALRESSLNALTLVIPLVSLDLLFFAFVAVQSRYMFGGEALIRTRTGLTYATYAREGFFQLVFVAALALVVLLLIDWLGRDVSRSGRRMLRVATGVLVGLVYVVMGSAMYRMWLYENVYGFTELRVYTTAFMFWLGIVFAWFTATVLRDRRQQFAFGTLLAGMAVVLGLHAFNPDAYIVQANFNRIASGHTFDADYAASLSADAVPTLMKVLPSLGDDARNTIALRMRADGQNVSVTSDLQSKWAGSEVNSQPVKANPRDDWRTWNWSSHRARSAVAHMK